MKYLQRSSSVAAWAGPFVTCLTILASPSTAQVLEPAVNLGATSFVDGAPPAGSGFYFNQYFQYYIADRINDQNGNSVPTPNPNLHLGALASLTQVIYMWDKEIPGIGAKPAIDMIIPLVWIDSNQPSPFTANAGVIGDVVLGPALQFNPIMGKKGPLFVHRLEAQMIFPSGAYSRDNLFNPGSSFFSFNPYWAGTLFLGSKCTLSYRAHYLWNDSSNEPWIGLGPSTTSTQAGQAFHMNFAASYEVIPKQLRVGVNGYWFNQFADDKINGATFGGSKEQVVAVGPGGLFSFSQTDHLFGNVYFETAAKNRPEGIRATLRYVHKF